MRPLTRRERGSASIELLGMLPLAIVFAALAIQVAGYLWAVGSANEAVRDAARAASLGRDACSAARDSLGSTLDMTDCDLIGRASVRITVEVPLLPAVEGFAPEVTITRDAHLPYTPEARPAPPGAGPVTGGPVL